MISVFIHIVTYNSAKYIERCVESVLSQQGFDEHELMLMVTDNASTDGTVDILERFGHRIELRLNDTNTGFTGAHNDGVIAAIDRGASFVLILNPDVRLESHSLRILVDSLESDPRAGTATPKLLRADEALEPVAPARLDSTGIYMTPDIRHFDRGSNELDSGQYERSEYVFGGTGAALLLRRSFVLDASLEADVPGERAQLFDSLFFAYREDAELAWRGQRLGWKCRYEPRARAYHVRQVLPENRAEVKPELNAYSVRNRFLMQAAHVNLGLGLSILARGMFRNLLVVLGVLVKEQSSVPALRSARALLPVALRRRRWTTRRARVRPHEIARWFSHTPMSEPALAGAPSGKKTRSVSALIVNYNSGDRLRACALALLSAPSTVALTVCVIDNGSTDESVRLLTDAIHDARLRVLELEENSGFAGALNRGAQAAPSDAYLVLNPDVLITPEAVETLVEALDANSEIGAVSPVLIGKDGRPQWAYALRSLPTLGSTLAELFWFHRLTPNNRLTARYLPLRDRFRRRAMLGIRSARGLPKESLVRPILSEQPAAACLLVRHSTWSEVGGFDERFQPAWFEDVDFSRRLLARGHLLAIEPHAVAIHEGGYSLDGLGRARFYRMWYPNLIRYWEKNGTRAEYLLLRLALPLALLSRAAGGFLRSFRAEDPFDDLSTARTLLGLAVRPR